jgi:hypothetical protein
VGRSRGIRGERGGCGHHSSGGNGCEELFLLSTESRELYCDMSAQIEARDLLVVTY